MASTQRQTTEAVIAGYNEWTVEALMATRAPDYTHQMLPTSLGFPQMNYQEFAGSMAQTMPVMKDFKLEVQDLIEDLSAGKTMIWATSSAETPVGPYKNEYAMILYFDASREKLVKMVEYVDSAFTCDFMAKLQALAKTG